MGVVADGQRVAVVTGGAGAIGGAIVAELSAAGHAVISLDLAGDPPVDLSAEHEVRAATADVLRRYGRCDVLVHAAAAFDKADLAAMDLTLWRRVQAVNVEAALLLCQAFVPAMASRGFGRVIFVVSDTVWSPPAARAGQPDELFAVVAARQALPRTLVPGDVAATVTFLASDAAAALTGQTLCVDGGLVLR
jgi:3-oxoacyl-[acyl-carrier protein] reductase